MQRCCCSLILHLCVHMLCMFCLHAAHVCCVWGKPTKGVRTIDSFRVNGFKWFKWLVKSLQEDFTDCKDALQSGGYFFMHCLRNNLSASPTNCYISLTHIGSGRVTIVSVFVGSTAMVPPVIRCPKY